MNESPTLDDFERSVVHALNVKADQLVVDDEATFDADGPPPPPITVITSARDSSGAAGPRSVRRHRRRLVAVAAAVVLLVGGAAILRTGSGDSGSVVASQPVAWYSDDVSSMEVPSLLPDGWTLTDVHPDSPGPTNQTTWQLFAVDGPSPLSRGVVVGSEPTASRSLPVGPTLTVRGQDAVAAPSNHPFVPAGAVEVDWAEGDYFHDVVAVGMTRDEVVDFLDSLTPRAGGAAGFDAPPGASLDELDTVTDAEQLHSKGARYTGPDGVGSLTVTADDVPFGGGLVHRLVGEPHTGGLMIRNGDDDWSFVSLFRADGWTVDLSTDSPAIEDQPGGLEATLDSLRPITPQALLDTALAQPVRRTATVDGWDVEVHGQNEDLAVCLTPPAHDPVCTLGFSDRELTTASALVDGEWVVVALTDGTTPTIATEPLRDAEPDGAEGDGDDDDRETLDGVIDRSDGRLVELVRVPASADAVSVMLPDSANTAYGTGHLRPGS
jgi:hypothetical protein